MELTDEQDQIVNHPAGHYGLILSVAGSGKTTTMAHRIKKLLKDDGVLPSQIQVLMFNRLAKEEFDTKLREVGIPPNHFPHVNTFHSYAYSVIGNETHVSWFGSDEELARRALNRSKNEVCKELGLQEDEIDTTEAENAIGLWKGALIPPHRAGYRREWDDNIGKAYVHIYKRYEEKRIAANAVTFDDFVPLALQLLEHKPDRTQSLRHIIVDEYQDVNLGQQKLVETLARHGADVMLVGDDDQTIYEWRGARSDYILGEFKTVFNDKPTITYKLTRSFRFGFNVAQTSFNTISHNTNRQPKDIVSHNPDRDSQVIWVTDHGGDGESANRELALEILNLVTQSDVKPDDIRVLGRTYAQLDAFSTQLLIEKIPFLIVGNTSIFKRSESQTLFAYAETGAAIDQPHNREVNRKVLDIVNRPNRYLTRSTMQEVLNNGVLRNCSLRETLEDAVEGPYAFNLRQLEGIRTFSGILEMIFRQLNREYPPKAGELLELVNKAVDLRQHYQNYYGEGENADNKLSTIWTVIDYANYTDLSWPEFINHVEGLDTTRGYKDDECIKLSTIHRVKGLEFDYIFVPDCIEGHMPVFASNDDPTYDTQERRPRPRPSESIESERRLFYVAATRAKKQLFVGSPPIPQDALNQPRNRSKSSRFIEEMELVVTQEIGKELVLAAQGKENKLADRCHQYSAFSKVVGMVKNIYRRALPNHEDQIALDQVELATAERPFVYLQAYDNVRDRQISLPLDVEEEDANAPRWGHLTR